MTQKTLAGHKEEALRKAIDNLARYKFNNFGYWAAIWVHLNQIDGKEPNPFRTLVEVARNMQTPIQNGNSDKAKPTPHATGRAQNGH